MEGRRNGLVTSVLLYVNNALFVCGTDNYGTSTATKSRSIKGRCLPQDSIELI